MNYEKLKKADLISLLKAKHKELEELKDDINEVVINIIEDIGICSDGKEMLKDFYNRNGLEQPHHTIEIKAHVSLLDTDSFDESDIELTVNYDSVDEFEEINIY